ncbi:MAG: histidinol-phosphatase [Bythopirellula sp.]|nr:histidinol-phosphatase [Bythopirellula sp.]
MNNLEINARLNHAVAIARQAGKFTLQHFRTPGLAVERKGDGSPVTIADQGAEKLLRKLIAEEFPQDAIVGEEFGETPGKSGFQWILDPIDGTKSFVSGVPLYTTLVAVMRNNVPLVGVIFAPAVDEMVYAATDQGCWHVINNGEPLPAKVSTVDSLAEAVFLTTCVRSYTLDRPQDGRGVFDKLAESCRVSRTWGDAFGYLLVATGRAEIMIDPIMNIWDAAALQPIIQEAGGKFFDWQGNSTVHSGEAVATNGALAAKVKQIVISQ